jgi:hypothetical protein
MTSDRYREMQTSEEGDVAYVRPDMAAGLGHSCAIAAQVMLFSLGCIVTSLVRSHGDSRRVVLLRQGIPCGLIEIGDTRSKVSLMSPQDYGWLTENLVTFTSASGDLE